MFEKDVALDRSVWLDDFMASFCSIFENVFTVGCFRSALPVFFSLHWSMFTLISWRFKNASIGPFINSLSAERRVQRFVCVSELI